MLSEDIAIVIALLQNVSNNSVGSGGGDGDGGVDGCVGGGCVAVGGVGGEGGAVCGDGVVDGDGLRSDGHTEGATTSLDDEAGRSARKIRFV